MSIRNLIILSQLNPPAQRSRVLFRERINSLLQRSLKYSVTLIEAGTGYGKSTAILSFINRSNHPVYWFTIAGTERDPQLFLAKLFTAFNQRDERVGDEALRILDMPDSTPQEALIAFINAVSIAINDETLFIMDDFHRIQDIDEIISYVDWLIENLPSNVHLVLSTRNNPTFPNLNKWRVKGDILEIDKDDLTFNLQEVTQLFTTQYGISLDETDGQELLNKTEGWAIGLQMVWQSLQRNPGLSIHQVLEDGRHSRTALFDYLADEVLSGLDAETQKFLTQTSILSKLDNATCDFLLNIENSDEILRQLHASGLFIEELRPGVYRYHQIFREFLTSRLLKSTVKTKELHRKIASYFQAHEYWEEAIYHLLLAEDYHQVNRILQSIGQKLIQDGRQESVNYWIHEIPEANWGKYPHIIYLLGEVNRFLGNFEEALEYYHMAERQFKIDHDRTGISKALRGQGQVFLDTIRPINADQLLQDALKLLDPAEMKDEVADLLVLTAENQLNLGFPESAERLLSRAKDLRPALDMETDFIKARVFLRTGRIQQGIELLMDREPVTTNNPPARPQRFHRESSLLLSLFFAIRGDADLAESFARQGIEIGQLLQSTFVKSVGFMRLGHALMLQSQHPFNNNGFERAKQFFKDSINEIDVTRIHVEPLWGLCRALGYTGDLNEAEQMASESLSIAKKAGDEWISILIQLSLGAGAVLTDEFDIAQQALTSAEVASLKVKDPFTLSVARMWLALKAWKQGFENTSYGYLEKILPIVREHAYEFLLTKESLLGLKDPEMIVPLLLKAHENDIERSYLKDLFDKKGLNVDNYHPGYSLWVRTFGEFRVWRGEEKLEPQDWKREKARQLFQLLISYRDKWMHRDQIINFLWPDSLVDNASNYLKVVLSTLNQIIEPNRPKGMPSFFIERRQDGYRINPNARVIVDTDVFIKNIEKGTASALERALNLYQGRYFEDSPIQEWMVVEVQYFHQQFLLAADKLIEYFIEHEKFDDALKFTYQVLASDELWESAYRFQMKIFYFLGRPSMIRKVFRQSQSVFQNELNTSLSSATIELYESLISQN
jgi:LuxR family transcriptional regulator, maltose regulon positive regulatory protein